MVPRPKVQPENGHGTVRYSIKQAGWQRTTF